MKILEYIERVYQVWDGTDEHASICLRYIELAITRPELNVTEDSTLLGFIEDEATKT